MADPYVTTVKRYVEVEEQAAVELRELVITRGDNISPSKLTISFGVLNDDNIYDSPFPEPLVIVDNKIPRELSEKEIPNPLDFLATTLRGLILDAVVPSDNPIAIALGMAGLPIRDAGKLILAMKQSL